MQRIDGKTLGEYLEEAPVIAAVKSEEGLARSLECESRVVFVLYGDLVTIPAITARIRKAGKTAFVHIDLVDGLASREVAADFIAQTTSADGIISTKPGIIRHAHTAGLLTVQRFFLLDSIALQNARKQLEGDAADFIEVLPGVMPKIIRRLAADTQKPLIAGGLINDKEDVLSALSAGAAAVSSTNPDVWFL